MGPGEPPALVLAECHHIPLYSNLFRGHEASSVVAESSSQRFTPESMTQPWAAMIRSKRGVTLFLRFPGAPIDHNPVLIPFGRWLSATLCDMG
jgi:hypothetical protein